MTLKKQIYLLYSIFNDTFNKMWQEDSRKLMFISPADMLKKMRPHKSDKSPIITLYNTKTSGNKYSKRCYIFLYMKVVNKATNIIPNSRSFLNGRLQVIFYFSNISTNSGYNTYSKKQGYYSYYQKISIQAIFHTCSVQPLMRTR